MNGRATIRRHLLLRRVGWSVRIPVRPAVAAMVLLLVLAVASCLAAAYGTYPVPLAAVLRAVTGQGHGAEELVLARFRLPRIVECILLGAALALSGAVFQTVSRNPLAAPDVIGVDSGAAVVAVLLLLLGAPAATIPLGAFLGALAALTLVAILGVRRQLSMYRLLLVGVGINSLAGAAITYLVSRPSPADLNRLISAQQWLLGSVSGASWPNVSLLGASLLLIAPVILAFVRGLTTIGLGDDIARALGTRVTLVQIVTVALAALLAAVTVSVAGPIGFVAFVSPHLARRIAGTPGAASLPVAMAIGANLLLLADYIMQRVLDPLSLPVGIATTVFGAPYLLLLVLRGERRTGIG